MRGTVVGRFGPEVHPKWGTTTMNNGIDIQAAMGTPVHAVAKGRVEYTSEDYAGYGQIVILNHGDGYYTLYAHLSEILVEIGASVESGQIIGRVGDTGSLKGPCSTSKFARAAALSIRSSGSSDRASRAPRRRPGITRRRSDGR